MEQTLGMYVDISEDEFPIGSKAIPIHGYMTIVLEYIRFLSSVKNYQKKQLDEKQKKRQLMIMKEKAKEKALKGFGSQNQIA